MNPARSFGPALLAGLWTDHWLYWLGPVVGAAVDSGAYQLIRKTGLPPRPRVLDTNMDESPMEKEISVADGSDFR